MKFCVAAIPVKKGRGGVVQLVTDDTARAEAFVRQYDQPDYGVYSCPNPLKENAARRSRDDVACVVTLHLDIDYKRLATPATEVRETIVSLLPFARIHETGGGLHVYLDLKEAYETGTEECRRAELLRTALVNHLCADPAPNHNAALMRVVGTHNSKSGTPFEVTCTQAGQPLDLTEIEEYLNSAGGPLFEITEEYKPATRSATVSLIEPKLLDSDAVLDDMPETGEAINAVQPRLLWTLVVREGYSPYAAVEAVVDATMRMAARAHPDWTRAEEFKCVTARMSWVLRCLQAKHWQAVDEGHVAHDTPPEWLPSEWQEGSIAACRVEGSGRPNIFRNAHGYCVRAGRTNGNTGNGNGGEEAMTMQNGGASHDPQIAPRVRNEKKPPFSGPLAFKAFDPATLPPRDWLFGKQYLRGATSITAGLGGRGKSSLDLAEAISLATGRNILGEQPSGRCRVWYHCGDDDMRELRRRVAAICQHHNIPLSELEGWLFLSTPKEFPLKAAEGYNNVVMKADFAKHITDFIAKFNIDVCIFDPLVTLHDVNEGTPAMHRVVQVFRTIAEDRDCAIELVHHTRKGVPGQNGDHGADDIRGSGAIHAAVRGARVLNVMSEADALGLVIEPHQRSQYVRIDSAEELCARPGEGKLDTLGQRSPAQY